MCSIFPWRRARVNESTGVQGFGDIRQLGYVVADIDRAVDVWARQLGVAPWTIIRNVRLNCEYRGQPSQPLIDVALSYRGDMQIELIQQKNTAPSPYRKMIESGTYGLHHTAYLSRDIHADIARSQGQGLALVCDINMPDGARYAYMQSPELGDDVYLEFLQATIMMKAMFRRGIAAAEKGQSASRAARKPVELDLKDWRTLLASLGRSASNWLLRK